MRISEIMSRGVLCTHPSASLQEAAVRMRSFQIGLLPVFDRERLVGMITDRDIAVRGVAEGLDPSTTRVRDVMTTEVISCYDDQLVVEATFLMQENQIRRLVVLNRDEQLVGVVSLGDLAVATGDEQLAESTLEELAERKHPRR
jgi:CBS domain-containing protein